MIQAKNLSLIHGEAPNSTWLNLLMVAAGMAVAPLFVALAAWLSSVMTSVQIPAFIGIAETTMTAPMLALSFVFWLKERKS